MKGTGNFMNTISRAYLFIGIFSLCLVFYLFLPVLFDYFKPAGGLTLWLENSENTGTEFSLLLLISALTAFGLTGRIDYFYARMRKWPSRRPRLGEIMKALDFISEEDLRKALSQQKLKLSDILVQAGHITPEQKDLALALQKKKNKMIGEILIELGFITKKELFWALEERNKKIGSILKAMNLVSDYDIDCALMLERKGRMDKSGKIIDMQ
jgi:hypothetical protein